MSRDAFSRTPHYILQELGLPWPDSTISWGQAVYIVSWFGRHPVTALEMVKVPLIRALVGAWHGSPGPPVSDHTDLAECVATESFLAFDLRYAGTTHPSLPPISDAMRAEAVKTPGGWLYCADPDIVTAGWLPYEAILSAALESELLNLVAPDGGLAVLRDEPGNNGSRSTRHRATSRPVPGRWSGGR